MIELKLGNRLDPRWPQGMVGRRDTRIVKNARIYLATVDGQVAKVGWGDLCLEQWHFLREITRDGLGLVAREIAHGDPLNLPDRSEAADATLGDLVPGLALALDSDTTILLNHPDPGWHALGAVSLPALDRHETRPWLVDRLAALIESA